MSHRVGDPSAKGEPARSARLSICVASGLGFPGYSYDELLAAYRAAAPLPCVATLHESDVAAYRVGDPPAGRVEIEITEAATRRLHGLLGDRDRLSDVFGEGPFVVTLDGQELYVGRCYFRIGAAALAHPVMHVEEADGRVVLRIGDVQGRWAMHLAGDQAAIRRIDPQEIRTLFEGLGRLENLDD